MTYIVPIPVFTPFLPSHFRGAFLVALQEAKNKTTRPNTNPFLMFIISCFGLLILEKEL